VPALHGNVEHEAVLIHRAASAARWISSMKKRWLSHFSDEIASV
jgi:hypothetical protein